MWHMHLIHKHQHWRRPSVTKTPQTALAGSPLRILSSSLPIFLHTLSLSFQKQPHLSPLPALEKAISTSLSPLGLPTPGAQDPARPSANHQQSNQSELSLGAHILQTKGASHTAPGTKPMSATCKARAITSFRPISVAPQNESFKT